MNGGYVMVDCKGLDLSRTTATQTISGLYAAIQAAMAYNKPICYYNCIMAASKSLSPVFGGTAVYDTNVYAVNLGGAGFTVTNADVVQAL